METVVGVLECSFCVVWSRDWTASFLSARASWRASLTAWILTATASSPWRSSPPASVGLLSPVSVVCRHESLQRSLCSVQVRSYTVKAQTRAGRRETRVRSSQRCGRKAQRGRASTRRRNTSLRSWTDLEPAALLRSEFPLLKVSASPLVCFQELVLGLWSAVQTEQSWRLHLPAQQLLCSLDASGLQLRFFMFKIYKKWYFIAVTQP